MAMDESPKRRGWMVWIGGTLAVILLLVIVAAFLIDEPVRRYIEHQVNRQLHVYSLRVGKLDLHPLTLSLDLEDVSLIQNRNPEPPMVVIPQWHASLQWTELLKANIVSDHVIKRPAVYVTRPQAKSELADPTKSTWQDAVRKIFPVRINELKIEDAEVTYFDHPKARPLKLSHVQVALGDISNRAPEQDYPSTIRLDAQLFKAGRVTLDGRANFLTKPVLALNSAFKLERVLIEDLIGLTGRYNLQLTSGLLQAEGRVEYAPWKKTADIKEFLLEEVKADYVYRKHPRDEAGRKEVAETAKEIQRKGEVVVYVKHGKVLHGQLGLVNKSTKPEYRVFMTDVNAELDNFSNRLKELKEGDAVAKVTGLFMGTGRTVAAGTFGREDPNPAFDLDVRIVKTELKSFNEVLRAYANVDVSKGAFSFFSQLSVKNGQVTGYVKPIFGNVEVYDPKQDEDKAVARKLYEAVVGGVVELLKNPRHDQVAAESDLSGPVANPQADTWQIVGSLIQNAFFKTILPGLEKERGRS